MDLAIFPLLLSTLFQTASIFHDVSSTRLIKSGFYEIKTSEVSPEEVQVNIHYHLKAQWYAPIKDQEGDLIQILPMEYTREEGYLNLEQNGPQQFKNVMLYHLGRMDIPDFPGSHHIRVVRLDNKWEAEAWYHPSIASTGWSQMILTLKDIPVLGDYALKSQLRR
jgi:hypothetical protein